jgi:hypothetical protein
VRLQVGYIGDNKCRDRQWIRRNGPCLTHGLVHVRHSKPRMSKYEAKHVHHPLSSIRLSEVSPPWKCQTSIGHTTELAAAAAAAAAVPWCEQQWIEAAEYDPKPSGKPARQRLRTALQGLTDCTKCGDTHQNLITPFFATRTDALAQLLDFKRQAEELAGCRVQVDRSPLLEVPFITAGPGRYRRRDPICTGLVKNNSTCNVPPLCTGKGSFPKQQQLVRSSDFGP